MDEGPAVHGSARRNEDIALDLMKFVAMTTGYGRTTSSGVGFSGNGFGVEARGVCHAFARVVWEVPGGGGREEVRTVTGRGQGLP